METKVMIVDDDEYIRLSVSELLKSEGIPVVTVEPGHVFKLNDTAVGLISIISAVQYDFFLTGVKFSTLKARGLI